MVLVVVMNSVVVGKFSHPNSYPHSLITFFLFVEAVKEVRMEKEKDKDTFKLNLYFQGL